MSNKAISLLFAAFCFATVAFCVELSISPVRHSAGQSMLISVEPAKQWFNGTVCGRWNTEQKRCIHRKFRGVWLMDGELYPDSSYSISLRSKGKELEAQFRTDYGVPFTPVEVVSVDAKVTSIFLSWRPAFPKQLHGPPTGYRLLVCQSRMLETCKIRHTLDNHTTLSDLHPMTRYSVSIWPFNIDSFGSVLEEPRISSTFVVETGSVVPPFVVPVMLASVGLLIIIALLLVAAKERFFPQKIRHTLLVEEDFAI